jgi:hypothetical protein
MRRDLIVLATALLLGLATDLATGSYYLPGVMPSFVVGVAAALVLGAKWLGRHLLDRPVDSRPGDLDHVLVADDPGTSAPARQAPPGKASDA